MSDQLEADPLKSYSPVAFWKEEIGLRSVLERLAWKLTDFSCCTGYMLLYLFAIRTMVLALASIFASRHAAAMVSGLMVSVVGLASGFVVQLQNMTWWTSWLRWMSPLYWTLHSLQPLDFANLTTVECSRNPLTRQETPGLVLKIQFGITNGQQALNYWAYDFDQLDHIYPIVMVVAFWLFFQLVQSVSLFFDPPRRKMSRHKRVQL